MAEYPVRIGETRIRFPPGPPDARRTNLQRTSGNKKIGQENTEVSVLEFFLELGEGSGYYFNYRARLCVSASISPELKTNAY